MQAIRTSLEQKGARGKWPAGKFESCEAIERALGSHPETWALSDGGRNRAGRAAVRKFDDLCRRFGRPVPGKLRTGVQAILLQELNANCKLLGVSAEVVLRATVYHGALRDIIYDPDFAELHDHMGVFRTAVKQHPMNPRAFLARFVNTLRDLETCEEFERFRDTPWVFRHAATCHPTDPKKFLRRALTLLIELEADPEFSGLRYAPGLFRKAAVSHELHARRFLRRKLVEASRRRPAVKRVEKREKTAATPDQN